MSASNTGPTVDSAAPSPQPSPDDTKRAASDSMRAGVDIRAKIHDVTLLALRNRRFDRHGMQEVVRAVTDGMALGAEQSRSDLRQALAEAFRGMDQALTRSAEAGGTALRQLALTGKDLSDTEIKQALATMKKLEDDFLATAGQAAEAASEKIRPELRRILDTARQTGTETGKMTATNMTELTQRFSVASLDVALAGMEVAAEVGTRFAQLAGGILGGIADALAEPRPDKKPN
jgi:Cu/Ag efflux protein CusF